MSAYLKIVSVATLLFSALPFATHAALTKAAAPLKSARTYRLVLSVGKMGLPGLTATLVNTGPGPVAFFVNSRNPSLVVEYKPAAGSPFSPAGWQRLKSNAERRHKPDKSADTETYDVLIKLAPMQAN